MTQPSDVVTAVSGTTDVTEGSITWPAVVASAAPGANADVGLVAVGAPVYAAGSHVLTVGVDKEYQTIASAIAASQDGDVILVDSGVYSNDFAVVNSKISLIAVGGRVTMDATVPPPNFKGILTVETDLTVSGFDFTGCRIPDDQGHNGAGIRLDFGSLTLKNDRFVGNQDGLLTNAGSGSITIDHCLFSDNGGDDGNGAGNIHNVYIGDVASATVTNSVFQNARVGHEFKSRAAVNVLTNNVFVSGVGAGTGSYDIDLPNGGVATLANNTIIKGPNAENYTMVHFGGEGIPYGGSTLVLKDNLLQSTNPSAIGLLNQTAVSAVVTGNVLDGVDPSRFIQGPATATNNADASGVLLPDATLVGVLPGSTLIIGDADPHTVILDGGEIQAVQGGRGTLTLDVRTGHIIAVGGSGGMIVTETAGQTGGNKYTTAAGSVNVLNLAGVGMNTIDSEGTDTILAGDGNQTGIINGDAVVISGAGSSRWSVNGSASIQTGTTSTFMSLGATGSLAITGSNEFFELASNGGSATWNTSNSGVSVVGSASGGGLSMQVYDGCARITTAGGSNGAVLHLDQGDANVRSLGADVIYAGAGYSNIIVSGAAQIYAGTGRLEVYGRSNSAGADVYGNGGDYLIAGDTGNITYHGGDKASSVQAALANITLLGGAGLMTINGGSRETIVGGTGGIVFHGFGSGANTITTVAGSSNLLEVSGMNLIESYGNDTIRHSDGNNTINVHGNSSLWIGGGNSHVYLAGKDTVTVDPVQGGGNWFTVDRDGDVALNVFNNSWIHDAGGLVSVDLGDRSLPGTSLATVSVSGVADLSTDPASGINVATSGASPAVINASGKVSIQSNGADVIHLGDGVADVKTYADGAEIWAGSGLATVSSGDWTSGDVFTVHGGSGSVSVTGCVGLMRFIGGSGSSTIVGTYGSLDITAGSGDTTVGWSSPYGGPTRFIAGSGNATVNIGAQGGYVEFGTGDTTVNGSDWAHATTYAFLADQSGTDILNSFVVGWDKIELGAGVSVVSQNVVDGSAHVMLSSGAHAIFTGITDTHGLFG